MWFKNLRVYHLRDNLKIDEETLEAQLKSFSFIPCDSEKPETQGFVAPLGENTESLFHVCNGQYLICARFEKKLLPASVVKDQMNENIEKFIDEKGRKPKGKEKNEIKDAVMLYLLPKAFAIHSDIYAWIDPASSLVFVDTSSAAKAESLLSLLRKALGSLPVEPLDVNEDVSTTMTNWLLNNSVPSRLQLGDQIMMYSVRNEKKVVNAKSDDLMENEIIQHLKQDKVVSKIALTFDDAINFTLDEDLSIKKIKFTEDFIKEESEQEDLVNPDPMATVVADIFAQLTTFAKLLPFLINQFGGISEK